MIADPASPVSRKPAGGVAAVQLASAANLREYDFSDGGARCTRLFFADNGAVMQCQLLEERSSFDESLTTEGGAAAVVHRLSLVADRNMAAAWLTPDFVSELICCGGVAMVLLADGRRFVVGISRKFGAEQPLRLKSLKTASGRRAVDEPTVELVLESADTAFAATLN